MSAPFLLVGLGNPGREYAANRHNIGFMALERVCARHGFTPFRAKFQGLVCEGAVAGRRVVALKPMTYMNESGRSVAQAARFFKVPPEDVLVVHDELDLAAGKLRYKEGGGHAGHNGLRSLHAAIGPDYRRLRIGIGHPGDRARVSGHVLKDFAKADRDWVEPLLDAIADHIDLLVAGDGARFTSAVALVLSPPRPKPAKPEPEAGDGV